MTFLSIASKYDMETQWKFICGGKKQKNPPLTSKGRVMFGGTGAIE